MHSNKKSGLLINMALMIFSLFVALILAEIVVRIFIEQETKRLAIYDKELGWRGRPNGKGTYIRKADNIRVAFKYNELGFRDDKIPLKKTDSLHIALIGDSFVESLEVEFKDVFHKLAENRLKKSLGIPVEIIALGSQGYSTAQELKAYRKYKDTIKADIVLLAFYTGNDFADNLRDNFAYLDDNGTLLFPQNTDSWLKVQYMILKRWLYESSHLVFFVKNLIESRTQLRFAADSKEESQRDKNYEIIISQKLISAARKEVEKTGAEFGVIIFPTKNELAENNRKKVELITDYLSSEGILYLDVFDSLKEKSYFKHDVHFNSVGHKTIADHLSNFILSKFDVKKYRLPN